MIKNNYSGKTNGLLNLTEEERELIKNWALPDVEVPDPTLDDKTNVMGQPMRWVYEPPEEEEVEEVKPLTAEEIEEIRLAAMQEGFEQGKESGFEEGYKEGRERGYEDGLEQGAAEGKKTGLEEGQVLVDEQIKVWEALISQLSDPIRDLDEHVEKELVKISVLLAEAVLQKELSIHPEIILNTIKNSISALPIAEQGCEIQLNPDDAQLVKLAYGEDELIERKWRIMAEPSISPGGCIVENRTSSINQTIEERVKDTFERFVQSSGLADSSQS